MIGFIIGLFVGAFIGVALMCLCNAASNADEDMKPRHYFWHNLLYTVH